MKKLIDSKKVKPIKPITPDEASEKRLSSIEPEMIQAVNNLILLKLDSSRNEATFKQDELISEYFKVKGIDPQDNLTSDLFKRHQLDIEDIFKDAGWNVIYDKPAYNESYSAYFTFKSRVKK